MFVIEVFSCSIATMIPINLHIACVLNAGFYGGKMVGDPNPGKYEYSKYSVVFWGMVISIIYIYIPFLFPAYLLMCVTYRHLVEARPQQ